jgi:hypothetical protein
MIIDLINLTNLTLLFFIILSVTVAFNFKKINTLYGYYKLFKNTVDPENKKNCCTLLYEMGNVFYKLVYFVKKDSIDSFKKHVKIPYKYKDKEYVYLLKKPRMIMPIEYIRDENDKDVLDEIYPYLGPNLDCHGVELYPSDFGFTEMKIKDINENEYLFTENQLIEFKLKK